MNVHELDLQTARRIAVRAQLLDVTSRHDLVDVVTQLTMLQVDPTAAIAPNADLVAWSRLGATFRPEHLTRALEQDRTLWEHNAIIRPMADLGLYLADMATWPSRVAAREWLDVNEPFKRDVLALLERSGPLLSRDIADTSVEPWSSTGWTNDRNVTQMLEFLAMQGHVAITGRQGRQRIWDLAERVHPPDVAVVRRDEAHRIRDRRRLRALGIARPTFTKQPMEPYHVGDAGEAATVDGVPGEWRVDPDLLAEVRDGGFEGRTALLSPFDRLVHDRTRAEQLFAFEYVLEMYKPKDQRRWGYFALPILHGDRLVGKLDAKADRKSGVLDVHAVHEDVSFDAAIRTGVDAEIESLAAWLGLAVRRA